MPKIKITLIIIFIATLAQAQKVLEPTGPANWSQNYQPFKIVGNVYYVGTYDLACYLITSPKGNILINTGLASSTAMIRENIEKLGFKFADTKILLTTQAHYDHVAAMAEIKKLTGALVMVDKEDAAVLADGGKSDYALGGTDYSYGPVKADKLLQDRDTIKLGDIRLVMLHHPGHTKGSCSYVIDAKDEKRTYKLLIANFPTIVTDKNFSSIPEYPGIARDYEYTLTALKNLKFDIWVASHASQFDLHKKHKPGDAYNPEAFRDQKGFEEGLAKLQAEFEKKLKAKG